MVMAYNPFSSISGAPTAPVTPQPPARMSPGLLMQRPLQPAAAPRPQPAAQQQPQVWNWRSAMGSPMGGPGGKGTPGGVGSYYSQPAVWRSPWLQPTANAATSQTAGIGNLLGRIR